MGASYLRCRHCKGFYETSFARCKWCDYDDPVAGRDGGPRIHPDRETCRAIQIAEYEQLPPEAHADCMGPPKDDLTLLCNCLHCGPDGHRFEAIEMRWMAGERMWACPCTTCGGRGFGIDVHSAENKWQCAECGHFYLPPDNDYHADKAKCPKCGCTQASGWFDDDYDEEALLDEFDDDLDEDDDEDEQFDDEEEGEGESSPDEFDLGISWQEREDDPFDSENRLPDDIDHPRTHDEPEGGFSDLNDDDIPF